MIVAAEALRGRGFLQAAEFPGRWSPKRSIPPDVEPAASALAVALERAGWWRPGCGRAVPGGLVVASDGACAAPLARFALQLGAAPDAPVGPVDFLFALPSTAAAVLGLLFGLRDYQATCVGGGNCAAHAFRHAVDLVALGRVERCCFVSLSARAGHRQAVAWCLEAGAGAPLATVMALPLAPASSIALDAADTTIASPPPALDGFLHATQWLASRPPPGAQLALAAEGESIVLRSQGRNRPP